MDSFFVFDPIFHVVMPLVFLVGGAFCIYHGKNGIHRRKIRLQVRWRWWIVTGQHAVFVGWFYIALGVGMMLWSVYQLAQVLLYLTR
jgi:hypothetical protein